MGQEILSVKLGQLEEQMDRLHRSIRIGQTSGHSQLRQEIEDLKRECDETRTDLLENLQQSRSPLVSVLAQSYAQVEAIVQESKDHLRIMAQDGPDEETILEEKILLAEYALDFAHQAANRALLLSLDAIDIQLLRQQEGRIL